MMRVLSLPPIGILVAMPVLLHPTSGFAAVGAVAGILCGAGALGRVPALVTAGGSLTLVQYTVALRLNGAPSSLLGAVGLSVALVLVLDLSDFLRRFHGATLTPPARRRQARHWVASAGLGALGAAAVGSVAALVRIGAPPGLYPLLAAAGALVAVAGAAGAVWRRGS